MKEWMHPVLGAVLGAIVGAGAARLARTDGAAARGAAPDQALAALNATLTELRTAQGELTRRIEALPTPLEAAAPSARVAIPDLDRAVAAYMESHPSSGMGASAGADDDGPTPEDVLMADRIVSGALSREEVQKAWKELRETGRIDAVLMEIERQAALEPRNPDLQNELGKAYLQKLFDVGIGPTAIQWGEKADRAFDQALEVDDHHWEARFQKAMALSNMPGFLGKQGESVRQFEVLAGQQESSGTSHAGYAMTYLFLGNLYDQSGEHDKARATWERGAARFPASEDLAAKLGN